MYHSVEKIKFSCPTCKNVDDDPDGVLGEGEPPLRHPGLDHVGSEHFHQDVELERVGEEDRQRQEEERHLGKSVREKHIIVVLGPLSLL